MAFASSGSAASLSSNAAWSACRNSAFSSSETLPSSASSLSPARRASGLTSTRVASSSTKTFHSVEHHLHGLVDQRLREAGLGDDRAGLRLVDAGAGSIGICFTASGLVFATSSISTPPSTLAMQR